MQLLRRFHSISVYILGLDKSFSYYTSQFPVDYNKNITFDIIDQALDFYWEILTERAQIKLVDQLRENQQVDQKKRNDL